MEMDIPKIDKKVDDHSRNITFLEATVEASSIGENKQVVQRQASLVVTLMNEDEAMDEIDEDPDVLIN